jgi:hypothetical protein
MDEKNLHYECKQFMSCIFKVMDISRPKKTEITLMILAGNSLAPVSLSG